MCMNPQFVMFNAKSEKYQFQGRSQHCGDFKDKPALIVPCGKCPECRAKWRTQLAQRVRWELEEYKNNCCFITLTVNNENLDKVFPNGSLNHEYFQKFMKRLRRHLEYRGFQGRIKYLMCGEYGHDNGRPHYHAIIMGWRPSDSDLRLPRRSQKGYMTYESELIQRLWSNPDATDREIEEFNINNPQIVRKNGKDYDYMPLGLVNVSLRVDENTAPYMVKYMVKFAEVKSDEFYVNGQQVRKPYLVYPKKVLGIDYFIDHIEQIMSNGFVMDSRGKYVGIPRAFVKFLEKSEDLEFQNYFELYKIRCEEFIKERRRCLELLGYDTFAKQYQYECEQGKVRREMYEAMKNNNR